MSDIEVVFTPGLAVATDDVDGFEGAIWRIDWMFEFVQEGYVSTGTGTTELDISPEILAVDFMPANEVTPEIMERWVRDADFAGGKWEGYQAFHAENLAKRLAQPKDVSIVYSNPEVPITTNAGAVSVEAANARKQLDAANSIAGVDLELL